MLRNLRWALLWALLILVLCLMPGQALPTWHWADLFSVDKLVHAFLFGILFLLLVRGFTVSGVANKVVLAFAIAVLYGALMEGMQTLPGLGRRGDLNDLLANSAGVILGYGYHRSRNGSPRSVPEPKDV